MASAVFAAGRLLLRSFAVRSQRNPVTHGYRFLSRRSRARRGTTAHLRHHLAPGRGQDHADREAAAVRWRDPIGGHGQGTQERAPRHLRLDGGGKAARHFGHQLGHAVRVRRAHHQPARYARPRGLFRGHLPRTHRRRRGSHGDRRRQGRRSADHQAARGVPAARRRRSSPSSTSSTARCARR